MSVASWSTDNDELRYTIEDAGGNRFNVVRHKPTVVAQELRWEEAVALAEALNEENGDR